MSKVYLRKFMFITAVILIFGFLANSSLFSLSQWSRKYGVSCNTCHSIFPRLTYFGEKFMRNGYQMPETQDDDEVGKKAIGNRLTIGDEKAKFIVRKPDEKVCLACHTKEMSPDFFTMNI